MIQARKFFVCCPGASITGGPELLHQLVDTLREYGHAAFISYYPFDQTFECPKPYRIYDAPQAPVEKGPDAFIVVPETATWVLRMFKGTPAAVWWLSVDNYLGAFGESWLEDKIRHIWWLIRGQSLPLWRLKGLTHFTQSAYASNFLERKGIKSYPLRDYINPAHFKHAGYFERHNVIAYNPKKGKAITKRLMKSNPDFKFVPIQGMPPEQVQKLLTSSKIYIDFGHHPGKERLPREAAMAGCCVVTGRRGSASFEADVPIPKDYKLDENAPDFEAKFRSLILSIFENYEGNATSFSMYKDSITREPERFRQDVLKIFGHKKTNS